MKVQSYLDARLRVIQQPSQPGVIVRQACNLTQKKIFDVGELKSGKTCSTELIRFLITAGHSSVLEPISWTFLLENVSRAFLAQVTRHRIGSFTSASQHYADYSDMPMILHPVLTYYISPEPSDKVKAYMSSVYASASPEQKQEDKLMAEITEATLKSALLAYETLAEAVPKEEARMVLPNASAVNLLWTVNARSLANFLTQRMCKRNVAEMLAISSRIYSYLLTFWPEFAKAVGPECMFTKCNQGKMTCGEPYDKRGSVEKDESVRRPDGETQS